MAVLIRTFSDGRTLTWDSKGFTEAENECFKQAPEVDVENRLSTVWESQKAYFSWKYPPQEGKPEGEKSGLSVDYYKVHVANPTTPGVDPYTAECNDLIESLQLTYAEANVFKAIWRSAAARTLGKKKAGNDALYDAEKMVFFSGRVLSQVQFQQKETK